MSFFGNKRLTWILKLGYLLGQHGQEVVLETFLKSLAPHVYLFPHANFHLWHRRYSCGPTKRFGGIDANDLQCCLPVCIRLWAMHVFLSSMILCIIWEKTLFFEGDDIDIQRHLSTNYTQKSGWLTRLRITLYIPSWRTSWHKVSCQPAVYDIHIGTTYIGKSTTSLVVNGRIYGQKNDQMGMHIWSCG